MFLFFACPSFIYLLHNSWSLTAEQENNSHLNIILQFMSIKNTNWIIFTIIFKSSQLLIKHLIYVNTTDAQLSHQNKKVMVRHYCDDI